MGILKQLFRKKYALILFLTCFTMSCYGSGDSIKNRDVLPKQGTIQILDSTLNVLKNSDFDKDYQDVIDFFIEKANNFALNYPEESRGGYYLELSAKILWNNEQTTQALNKYNQLIQVYPDYENIEKALYHKAVILDLDLREKQKAIEAYQFLLEKFPDTVFREDAESRIQNIDLSVEDIIDGN